MTPSKEEILAAAAKITKLSTLIEQLSVQLDPKTRSTAINTAFVYVQDLGGELEMALTDGVRQRIEELKEHITLVAASLVNGTDVAPTASGELRQ